MAIWALPSLDLRMGEYDLFSGTRRAALEASINGFGWGLLVLGVLSIVLDAVCLFATIFDALLPLRPAPWNSVANACSGVLPIIATLILLHTGRAVLARRSWVRRGAMWLLPAAAALLWPWPYRFAGWWVPLGNAYALFQAGYFAAIAAGGLLLGFILSRPALQRAFTPERPLNWEWIERQKRRGHRAVRTVP